MEVELVKNLSNNVKATPKKFEERIKKQKIHSFDTKGGNFKLSNKNKIIEVKLSAIFSKHFIHCFTTKNWYGWNVEVPFDISSSLLGSDRWVNAKTTSSLLLKKLETRVISEAPSNIETLVIGGTFFLRFLKKLPETFGLVAISISKKVCEASNAYLLNIIRVIKDAKMKTHRLYVQ